MYEIVLKDDKWWIAKDGEINKDIGGFIDPISPEIILKEILNDKRQNVSVKCSHSNGDERTT